jgi:hypothetical protein
MQKIVLSQGGIDETVQLPDGEISPEQLSGEINKQTSWKAFVEHGMLKLIPPTACFLGGLSIDGQKDSVLSSVDICLSDE